jgi:Divergent InlB B-repeat domain
MRRFYKPSLWIPQLFSVHESKLAPRAANVTVIDGATNSTTTITDPYLAPGIDTRGFSLAVNAATDKIYVADESDSNGKGHVSVIDGSTNSVVMVTDPDAIAPVAVAVDPATNTIYVANGGSLFLSGSNPGSVTVIDGATDSITTVVDPKADVPNALAVNPVTNTIYVANFLSANVTVIRGATGRSPGFTLSVTGNGNGSGTVTSNPAGIECPVSCSASFLSETTVTLAATPHATSNFTGWTGACSSTSACSVTMDAAASVTAIFTLQDFSLTPASTKLIVQPGARATDVMSLAGLNGPFGNAIQLTCATTGPSPAPTCALSAASVTPGANSSTSTLTITAPAAAAMRLPSSHPQLSKFLYAMWLPLVFGITVVGEAKKIPRRHWILYGFLAVMFISQTACGGGNSSSNSVLHQAPTNYTVTVTGASGAIQHTTQIAVTVQ